MPIPDWLSHVPHDGKRSRHLRHKSEDSLLSLMRTIAVELHGRYRWAKIREGILAQIGGTAPPGFATVWSDAVNSLPGLPEPEDIDPWQYHFDNAPDRDAPPRAWRTWFGRLDQLVEGVAETPSSGDRTSTEFVEFGIEQSPVAVDLRGGNEGSNQQPSGFAHGVANSDGGDDELLPTHTDEGPPPQRQFDASGLPRESTGSVPARRPEGVDSPPGSPVNPVPTIPSRQTPVALGVDHDVASVTAGAVERGRRGVIELNRLAVPNSVRVGIDFGTSLTKLIGRAVGPTGDVLADAFPIGDAIPSAVAIHKTNGKIWFGQDALNQGQLDPSNIYLQRSLKRLLLTGRAEGVEQVDRSLSTSDLAVFWMAWLYQEATARCLCGVQGGGDVRPDIHLTSPVSGPYANLRPFWLGSLMHTQHVPVDYSSYLKHLAVAGAALCLSWQGALPDTWKQMKWATHGLFGDLDAFYGAFKTLNVQVTSEPLAALNLHTSQELEDGLIIVVDSGAGTTDWTVFLKYGSERVLLAEGSMHFGGQDVDDAMLRIVKNEWGELIWKARGEPHEWQIRDALSKEKERLFEDEEFDAYVEFDPITRLSDGQGLHRVTIDKEEVTRTIRTKLNELGQAVASSLRSAEDRIARSKKTLERRGIPLYRMRNLETVFLVGGNSYLPCLKDAVASALETDGIEPHFMHLPVPQAELAMGRRDEVRYRRSAVAIGASMSRLPNGELLPPDDFDAGGNSVWDRDAG